jgi:hypothetical protein
MVFIKMSRLKQISDAALVMRNVQLALVNSSATVNPVYLVIIFPDPLARFATMPVKSAPRQVA